jgi:hypothetical protein
MKPAGTAEYKRCYSKKRIKERFFIEIDADLRSESLFHDFRLWLLEV